MRGSHRRDSFRLLSMSQNLNIWDVVWMNQVQIRANCSRKVQSGRMVAGAFRRLVNAKDLQLE